MTATVFDRALSTPEMLEVFGAASLLQAMLDFEAALARAEAAEGLIPGSAAAAIAACCRVQDFDLDAIVETAAEAGSLAIPLVQMLTRRVAAADPAAAGFVHRGSTSQDVIDSALVLVTGRALALIDRDLGALGDALLELAGRHLATPMLGRTLLQPAQVISFGAKLVSWGAPLVRARERLRCAAAAALQVQLGGAVGTLDALGAAGAAVARRVAAELGLHAAAGSWHTQRDTWVALGCEIGVLCGSLGKIAKDLALLSQAEVGEVAEPGGAGRGGSSAMPHKRNAVGAMVALAAAQRVPHRVAALLAAMPQEHERGLGGWQAEVAEWPGLFLSAHGAVRALATVAGGLEIDVPRMRQNIEALHGLVFSEALALHLGVPLGKAAAHDRVEGWSRQALREGRGLRDIAAAAVAADAVLASTGTPGHIDALFDIDAAAQRAGRSVQAQLEALCGRSAALAPGAGAAPALPVSPGKGPR